MTHGSIVGNGVALTLKAEHPGKLLRIVTRSESRHAHVVVQRNGITVFESDGTKGVYTGSLRIAQGDTITAVFDSVHPHQRSRVMVLMHEHAT